MDFAAELFKVPRESLSPATAFRELPAWDSVAHLSLAQGVESRYGVAIPIEAVATARTLWDFYNWANGGAVKKVLALDLDNTLWSGVIGEDGVGGIVPDVRFQREIKALKERGILLVALSKNDAEVVAPAWKRPDMILSPDDFVLQAIDWNPKPQNLLRMADELGLHPSAFVFVDDNAAERARMSAECPEVTVADFPPQLSLYFPERPVTDEDRFRTECYRADLARRRSAANRTPDEWLENLKIVNDIHPMTEAEVPRVAELSQRANRFNFTASRRTEAELRAACVAPNQIALTMHSRDRFGDLGLIAFARAEINGEAANLLDFTMSCRAFGRRLEEALKNALASLLRARGIEKFAAKFVPTGRNEQAKGLYS